jgi:NAD(P)H-dependent FMN reductase
VKHHSPGSIPSALKNAIDFLYSEWNNKAAGFVALQQMLTEVIAWTSALEPLRRDSLSRR